VTSSCPSLKAEGEVSEPKRAANKRQRNQKKRIASTLMEKNRICKQLSSVGRRLTNVCLRRSFFLIVGRPSDTTCWGRKRPPRFVCVNVP
jgi:hypothetical protein